MERNQEKLAELLGWLMDTVKGAGEFVKDQAPDVARQMVAYGIWSNAALLVMAMVCLGVVAAAFKVLVIPTFRLEAQRTEVYTKEYGRGSPTWLESSTGKVVPTCIISVGIVVLVAIIIGTATPDLIKASVAPKLFVLEQCAEMLKRR